MAAPGGRRSVLSTPFQSDDHFDALVFSCVLHEQDFCTRAMFEFQIPHVDLYPGMIGSSWVQQLDVLFVSLTFLTLLHAISKRGLVQGLAVVAYFCVHTAVFEHISLFLGGTHCHASSTILPMVTPCSSMNSVLFYVPWTYTSIEYVRVFAFGPFFLGQLDVELFQPLVMIASITTHPSGMFLIPLDQLGLLCACMRTHGGVPLICTRSEPAAPAGRGIAATHGHAVHAPSCSFMLLHAPSCSFMLLHAPHSLSLPSPCRPT
jgi:hypothetical protein